MKVNDNELSTQTLAESLHRWSETQAEKVLYRFLDGNGKEAQKYTYAEFELETRAVAHYLSTVAKLKPGDKALLVYPPGLDFIVAFVGCIRARVIAVPVYPPRPGANKDLTMFLAVQQDCGVKTALTNSLYGWAKRVEAIKSAFRTKQVTWPQLDWHVTNGLSKSKLPSSAEMSLPKVDEVAFLQYTSGSTSSPKGVIITHGNLRHNLATIIVALEAGQDTVVVSWLPQYHDMGLIGSYLGVLYCGGSGAYISPISFVKSPPLWMELASRFKATHLQAPNFAYSLVARKWNAKKSKPNLSLSSVRHIFNAAEPIDADAIESFLSVFTPHGLNPSAMQPGYGLAESTVYVCDGGEQRLWLDKVKLESDNIVEIVEPPPTSDESSGSASHLVGCGFPSRLTKANVEVLVMDPTDLVVLPEDRVGEVWISSNSCSQGYLGKEEKNKVDMHAKVASNVFADGTVSDGKFRDETMEDAMERISKLDFVRTGDLGFFHNQELFICGRIKDLVIVRGRNHYPQDLELSAEKADDRLRPGCSAAFTVMNHQSETEALVLVAEVRSAAVASGGQEVLNDIVSRINIALTQEHGVSPATIVLIKERTVDKTTSGKISRHRVRNSFLTGKLQVVKLHNAGSGAVEEITEVENGSANEKVDEGSEAVDVSTLSAEEVIERLKEEASRLMITAPESVDADTPLQVLGMDSMAIAQFRGVIQTTFSVELEESELFEEGITIRWIQQRVQSGDTPPPNTATGAAQGGGRPAGKGKGWWPPPCCPFL